MAVGDICVRISRTNGGVDECDYPIALSFSLSIKIVAREFVEGMRKGLEDKSTDKPKLGEWINRVSAQSSHVAADLKHQRLPVGCVMIHCIVPQ